MTLGSRMDAAFSSCENLDARKMARFARIAQGDEMINPLTHLAFWIARCFPRMAMAYRHMREGWQLYQEPKQTPLGFKLAGNPIMLDGHFEPEETQLVKTLLPHVDVVINVGANIGYYCSVALNQNKPVVAFEPMPQNLHYLYRNMQANHWESKIEIYPMALSNQVGIANIYGGGTGASLVQGWAGASTQSRQGCRRGLRAQRPCSSW